MTFLAKILVVSDSVDAGRREDQAGPLLASRLEEAGFDVTERRVVPDGIESVAAALREQVLGFSGLIITTGGINRHNGVVEGPMFRDLLMSQGVPASVIWVEDQSAATGGTGFSARDLTPEATLQVLEREAPGLCEAMRSVSALGPLSRARSGTVGRSLILNTPGSPAGALESLEAVLAILPHALGVLLGEGDHHPPDIGGSTAISS